MVKVLEGADGELKFSEQIEEYILDSNMELKAVKLKNGDKIDHTHLHSHFTPKHPLLNTPEGVRSVLDQFFVEEFKQKRSIC